MAPVIAFPSGVTIASCIRRSLLPACQGPNSCRRSNKALYFFDYDDHVFELDADDLDDLLDVHAQAGA
jgi:hypothetical protein